MEMSVDSNTFKFTPLLLQVDVLDSQKVPEETLDKVQACVWYYNFFVGIQPKFAQGIFSPNQELLSDPKYSKYRQDDDTLKFEYKNNDDICNYSAFDSKISGHFNFKGLRAKFNGELSENGNNTKTIKYFMEGVRNDSLTTTYLNISSGRFNSWNVVTSYDILLLKGWDHKKYAQMSVKFSNYRIKSAGKLMYPLPHYLGIEKRGRRPPKKNPTISTIIPIWFRFMITFLLLLALITLLIQYCFTNIIPQLYWSVMLSYNLSLCLNTPQQNQTETKGKRVFKRGEAPLFNILPLP